MNNKIFNEFSDDWWKEDGAFKALHSFNLLRLKYIKERILKILLRILKILDIGCGVASYVNHYQDWERVLESIQTIKQLKLLKNMQSKKVLK